MHKRGSIELSTSTIIIIVLAILMLTLGIVLVKKIMCGAITGIGQINEETGQQITDLFQPNSNIAIKERSNNIYKGVDYGVGFAIRNNGESNPQFSYSVEVSDLGKCSFSKIIAENFMLLGKTDSVTIISGEEYVGLIRFSIPKDVENCDIRYKINVKHGIEEYATDYFDVKILDKGFTRTFC